MEDIRIQTYTEEMTIKATERVDDFMFEFMQPYCERASRRFITKKDLKNALTQYFDKQPCEDCISRKAVEKITWEDPSYSDPLNVLTEVRDKIRALPSVQPIKPCEDMMSVIEDIKAEFISKYPKNFANEPELGGYSCAFSLNKVLKIIDKHIADMRPEERNE